MTRSRSFCLASCAGLLLARAASAQVLRPEDGTLSTATEVARISAWSLGAEVRVLPIVGGEALEGLGAGIGGSVSGGIEFDERIELRAALGLTSHDDDLASERAVTIDVLLDLAWTWSEGGLRAEVGPILGYSWLDRGIYTRTNGGVLAGAGVSLYRSLSGALEVVASVAGHWTYYSSQPLVPPAPADPDGGAIGAQLEIGVGIAWRFRER